MDDLDKRKQAYISGALTGLPNVEQLKTMYEKMAMIVEGVLADWRAYLPHQNSDPLAHPNITPAEVYELDETKVSESGLVISYVGEPSFGVGQEAQIAHDRDIPIILVVETNKVVSRMILGIPSVNDIIRFDDENDMEVKLVVSLQEFAKSQTSAKA